MSTSSNWFIYLSFEKCSRGGGVSVMYPKIHLNPWDNCNKQFGCVIQHVFVHSTVAPLIQGGGAHFAGFLTLLL